MNMNNKVKIVEVEESTEYDNFIRDNEDIEETKPQSIFSFMGVEDPDDEVEWKKHWVEMPEFKQENNPPYKKLILNFRNKEDYETFGKLVEQNLSEKTKSIWYPKLDRDENSLKRWIEQDE
jgi:hypothetical protein